MKNRPTVNAPKGIKKYSNANFFCYVSGRWKKTHHVWKQHKVMFFWGAKPHFKGTWTYTLYNLDLIVWCLERVPKIFSQICGEYWWFTMVESKKNHQLKKSKKKGSGRGLKDGKDIEICRYFFPTCLSIVSYTDGFLNTLRLLDVYLMLVGALCMFVDVWLLSFFDGLLMYLAMYKVLVERNSLHQTPFWGLKGYPPWN